MKLTRDQMALKIAWKHYNIPYKYGGKSPLTGFDCSGLTQDCLRAVDAMPRKVMSSGMQWVFYLAHGCLVKKPRAGCLVFYGSHRKVNHVMLCISGTLCIGAAGGNSRCVTPEIAALRDARVKVLPIDYRKDIIGYVDPFNRGIQYHVDGKKKEGDENLLPNA